MATRTRLRVNLLAPDGSREAARGLAGWLARTAPASARGEVTVALVSDHRMRSLNRIFRGKDYVTDVLSFAVDAGRQIEFGDIVIATGVAVRQAKEYGHSIGTELRVLALHGLLHLLGYDHEVDAGRMARAEARLRKKGGLPTGLIGRTKKEDVPPRRSSPGTSERRRAVSRHRS
jgi:probable rRNA maturation factor